MEDSGERVHQGGDGGALANELIRSAGTIYDFPDFRPLERTAIGVPPEILKSLARRAAIPEFWQIAGPDSGILPSHAKAA